jgi:hypothetical protein
MKFVRREDSALTAIRHLTNHRPYQGQLRNHRSRLTLQNRQRCRSPTNRNRFLPTRCRTGLRNQTNRCRSFHQSWIQNRPIPKLPSGEFLNPSFPIQMIRRFPNLGTRFRLRRCPNRCRMSHPENSGEWNCLIRTDRSRFRNRVSHSSCCHSSYFLSSSLSRCCPFHCFLRSNQDHHYCLSQRFGPRLARRTTPPLLIIQLHVSLNSCLLVYARALAGRLLLLSSRHRARLPEAALSQLSTSALPLSVKSNQTQFRGGTRSAFVTGHSLSLSYRDS